MAFVAYVNATQHIAAGGKTYDIYDKNAYRMGSNLDPGASTANTVGTSADPFAAVYGAALYATTYYLGGVAETLTPTQSVATTYTISTTIGAGSDTALATTSAVAAFASTTGNLTTTLTSASTPYYFTGVTAATAGNKTGIYVATGAYMKDGLLYSGGAQVLTSYTDTTYTFASGTNGFTVTPSGGSAQTVTVTPSITNNVTGSGTSGYLAKWTGTNVIANGPALGTATTTYLRNDGTWATPAGTYSLPSATTSALGGVKVGAVLTAASGAATDSTTTTQRYAVQIDSNNLAFVRVPWTNVNSNYLTNITGLVTASTPLAISGSGTAASPYAISFTNPGYISAYDNHAIQGDGTTVATAADSYTVNIVPGTALSIAAVAATSSSTTGTITINHSNYVTAGTVSDGGAARTLGWGDTFKIPSVTYNAQGHITSTGTTTLTMPANPDTNTWRPISYKPTSSGSIIAGLADSSTTAVLAAGTNMSVAYSGGTFTFNNTYSYSLPLAADGTRGGIQIGYAETSTPGSVYNAAVQLSSEKAYVAITQAAILAALSPTTLPITSASSTYTIATSIGSGSTTAIPTTSAVLALGSTKTDVSSSFSVSSSLSGTLYAYYYYSDGVVHLYGIFTTNGSLGGGSTLISTASTTYFPINRSVNGSCIFYVPFKVSGATYPSNRIAMGYTYTGAYSFINFSTTSIPSGGTLYVDIYYKVV
ncbi:MAG: hypothetical protein ABFC95_02445 [Smithella sp.]